MRDPRPAAAALVALLAGRGTGRSMGAGPVDGARPHGPDGGPLGEETFGAPRRRRLALHRRHAIRATTGEGGEEEVDEVDDGEGSPARRDLADSSDAGNLDSDNEHSDSDDDEEECACDPQEEGARTAAFRTELHRMKMTKQQKKKAHGEKNGNESRRLREEDEDDGVEGVEGAEGEAERSTPGGRRLKKKKKKKKKKDDSSKSKGKRQNEKKSKGGSSSSSSGSSKGSKQSEKGGHEKPNGKGQEATKGPSSSPVRSPTQGPSAERASMEPTRGPLTAFPTGSGTPTLRAGTICGELTQMTKSWKCVMQAI